MAITVENSGTQSATIGTEHTLATVTGAKVLILMVNCTNMVNGDEVELRVKTKVLTGDSVEQTQYAVFTNIQSDKIKYSIPIASPFTAEFSLKQTAGTGRDFKWSVMSV